MSALYNIYIANTISLARTMVVKFDFISKQINQELIYQGYQVHELAPNTHKYYMNLSGEYHESDKAKLKAKTGHPYITIPVLTSNGTVDTDFTKELFHGVNGDITLLNEYAIGSDYYNRLLTRYPEYESLINGILNPINMDCALKAPNGTILSIGFKNISYNDEGDKVYITPDYAKGANRATYIEPQEYNLIEKLQEYTDKVLFRWYNGAYSITDDLYVPYFLGMYYSNIPAKILNIRMGNVHTAMAHSFHVREFLESHGKLGKYIPFIPYKQIMYLYRNLKHFNLNMGKTWVFEALIDNMLTPLGVPLAGYELKHDTSVIDGVFRLTPATQMVREHLNFRNIGASSDIKSVRYVLDAQKRLAKDNDKYLDYVEKEITDAFDYSGDDNLKTKVLESEMFDVLDQSPADFYSMRIWYWVYLASIGKYKGSVFVSNPTTGERIVINTLDAFILMLYCINYGALNRTLVNVPRDGITVYWITKSKDTDVLPRQGDYKVEPDIDELVKNVDLKNINLEKLHQIKGNYVGKYSANTPNQFYSLVKSHYDELTRKYFEVCKVEDLYGRGFAEYAMREHYWMNVPVSLTNETINYKQWLPKTGINFSDFSNEDYINLGIQLVNACIGNDDTVSFSKKQMQDALISIMKHFSSYTTHYIYSINESTVSGTGGLYPRMTNFEVEGEAGIRGGIDISIDMFGGEGIGEGEDGVTASVIDLQDGGVEDIVIHGGTLDVLPTVMNSVTGEALRWFDSWYYTSSNINQIEFDVDPRVTKLDKFDFVIVSYSWVDANDLDTRTRIQSTDGSTNQAVGWSREHKLYNGGLHWGGDVTSGGEEHVAINFDTLQKEFHYDEEIVIELRAMWYRLGAGTSNRLTVSLSTYNGKQPSVAYNRNFNITNEHELVQRYSFDVELDYISSIGSDDGALIGYIVFNRLTKKYTLVKAE